MEINISTTHNKISKVLENHASCRIRTCGPLLRRQLLYPAELRKHLNIISDDNHVNNYLYQSEKYYYQIKTFIE